MRRVITKARIKKLGLKTANVQRTIMKMHRACMMNESETSVHYNKKYKGYAVKCNPCSLTATEAKI